LPLVEAAIAYLPVESFGNAKRYSYAAVIGELNSVDCISMFGSEFNRLNNSIVLLRVIPCALLVQSKELLGQLVEIQHIVVLMLNVRLL
jgi:hypothetical protein